MGGNSFAISKRSGNLSAEREGLELYLGRRSLHCLCAGVQRGQDDRSGKKIFRDHGGESRPVQVEFPTTIEVLEREELSHIKAQASGADNKIGSRMKVDLDVNLREQDGRTILGFVAGVDILGKLAALGHGIIKRKADQVLDEFAQAVKKRLEGDA